LKRSLMYYLVGTTMTSRHTRSDRMFELDSLTKQREEEED
jgi:hypothetical protein